MNPSDQFIKKICTLYGSYYDDRDEDSRPGGADWNPGELANHKSLTAFQKELADSDIKMSTSKIRKILISGGCWTTERIREVERLYEKYRDISRVAKMLGVSEELVCMYLPYGKVVYDLEEKSSEARRVEKWRGNKTGTLGSKRRYEYK